MLIVDDQDHLHYSQQSTKDANENDVLQGVKRVSLKTYRLHNKADKKERIRRTTPNRNFRICRQLALAGAGWRWLALAGANKSQAPGSGGVGQRGCILDCSAHRERLGRLAPDARRSSTT
jgi:hypothetical protein